MFGITDYTQKIVDYGKFEFSMLTDALGFGGAMLLIGMATIFSVLIIIWLSSCLVISMDTLTIISKPVDEKVRARLSTAFMLKLGTVERIALASIGMLEITPRYKPLKRTSLFDTLLR